MKIGFLGGTFDPVHFGHLIAAQDVLEQFHLDRLLLVPAAQAPLKPNDVQSTVENRLAMLQSATEWDRRLEISDYELRKGGISYTIDSVRHFRAQFPGDELFWIIGCTILPCNCCTATNSPPVHSANSGLSEKATNTPGTAASTGPK